MFDKVLMMFLYRLIQDRELQLYDGRRLLSHDRYDELVCHLGEERLEQSGVLRIHPAFRVIVLAEPPGKSYIHLLYLSNHSNWAAK